MASFPVDLPAQLAAELEAGQARAELAVALLLAVPPSDRALAGWGLGDGPAGWLKHMAQRAGPTEPPRWRP